jgi:AmiR/NasT family two-component response regulator
MADVATIGILQQRSIRQAQEVQAQLQGALQSRVAIEQAKGVVAEQAGVGVDDAFDLLRAHARGTGTKLSVVVQRVLTGEQRASDLG